MWHFRFFVRAFVLAGFLVGCDAGITPVADDARSAVTDADNERDEAQGTPGATCVADGGEEGVISCGGFCVPARWIGDDTCNNQSGPYDLFCEALHYDGGDCPVDHSVPGSPGTACQWDDDTPGVIDCLVGCVPADMVGDGTCHDGSWWSSPSLDCAALQDDGGDCGNDASDSGSSSTDTNADGSCQMPDGSPGIIDCDGVCTYADWVGDGYCDDYAGANLDCALHQRDGGDCTD